MKNDEELYALGTDLQAISRSLLDILHDYDGKLNLSTPAREKIEEIESQVWQAVVAVGVNK